MTVPTKFGRAALLLSALFSTQVASAIDLRTLVELDGTNTRYRAFLGRPDQAQFATMAAEFLGSHEIKVGVIASYVSQADYVLAGPRGGDHCSYEAWRAMIDSRELRGAECPETREAIKIGDKIVIRSVRHDCRRNVVLLRGQANPLDLVISGHKVEVLEVSFSRPIGKQNTSRIAVDLYVRVHGTVSKDLAEAITDQIRLMTGVPYLGVRVRSDIWFVTDCGFPALYPFEERPKTPTKEDFYKMPYAACFIAGSWPVRCIDGAGRP